MDDQGLIDLPVYEANLIGSDYHYSQTESFRKIFEDNAIDPEYLKMESAA
jgi:hypothetical protein